MKNVKTLLGLLIFCTLGRGKGKPLGTALCLYFHKNFYVTSTVYNYKKLNQLWGSNI